MMHRVEREGLMTSCCSRHHFIAAAFWGLFLGCPISGGTAQAASPDYKSAASHGVTDVAPVSLPDFVNRVESFTPDGQTAVIVKAVDDEGRWIYMVTSETQSNIIVGTTHKANRSPVAENNQQIVPFIYRSRALSGSITHDVTMGDDPQHGMKAILFARAAIDGRHATVLFSAERESSGPEPTYVRFIVYRFTSIPTIDASEDQFVESRTWTSVGTYCDASTALQIAVGMRDEVLPGKCH
jgi:hypothetical protein